MMYPHGRPAGYAKRCRCSVCVGAETQRKRDYRATRVVVLPTAGETEPVARKAARAPMRKPNTLGVVEAAVIAETDPLQKSAENPAMVEAVHVARVMDNDDLIAMWPQTRRQLHDILIELNASPRRKSGSCRAAVRQLRRVK